MFTVSASFTMGEEKGKWGGGRLQEPLGLAISKAWPKYLKHMLSVLEAGGVND